MNRMEDKMEDKMQHVTGRSQESLQSRTGLARAVAIVGLMALALVQSACTDREVAAGVVGAVIGGAIVSSQQDSEPPPPPRCRTDVQVVCRPYVNPWGVVVRHCEEVRTRVCNRRYSGSLNNMNLTASQISPKLLAEAYQLSDDSAGRLADVLVRVDKGDTAAFGEIGLDQDDLGRIAQLNRPKDESIERMAQSLAISSDNARKIVDLSLGYAKSKIEKAQQQPLDSGN